MRYALIALLILLVAFGLAMLNKSPEQKESWDGCAELHLRNRLAEWKLFPTEIRPIATERLGRFLGKPSADDPMKPYTDEATKRKNLERQKNRLLCRGGRMAFNHKDPPWADWSNYWATGDADSLPRERSPNYLCNL